MIQENKAQTEQTPITTIRAMNDRDPFISMSGNAKVDDPKISQASGDHQTS
jgi:hypothetical protein